MDSHHRPPQPPLTDEQLQAVTLGELIPYANKVVVVDYDPAWPSLFQREADRITASLGARALRVEHVGSTDKELKVYPQLYHEVFNEPEQAAVLDDVTSWIEARI